MLTGQDITSGLGEVLLQPLTQEEAPLGFHNVVVDSRKAQSGDLFVALPGERQDGHQFIADALQRGARGVLAKGWPEQVPQELRSKAVLIKVAEPLAALQALASAWRARFSTKVIGVTGSVGKTSTKEAIATVLRQRFQVYKSEGNLNTEIGLPLALLELQPEHQRAILEMGMYQRGDIALLCQLAQPSVGVVTNIGPSHLERLGSIEAIAAAKAELVESLPPTGVAVLNQDDPLVAAMRHKTQAQVVTYGLVPEAQCRAADLCSSGLEGISFRILWHGEDRQLQLSLPGRHNVYTALAAAAVGFAEGLSLDEVARGLESLGQVARIKMCRTPQGAIVIDDSYNASPASMKAALDLLSEMSGAKIAVLGDMLELGSYEQTGHEEVGRYAAARVDALYTLGQRGGIIAESARAAGLDQVRHLSDQASLAAALRGKLTSNVYVLVKASRGMALEKLIARLCES